MGYSELSLYTGPKKVCANCGTVFLLCQVVTVESEGLVFCYTDRNSGCMNEYLFYKLRPMRDLFGEPMIYRERAPMPDGPELYTCRPQSATTFRSRIRRAMGKIGIRLS